MSRRRGGGRRDGDSGAGKRSTGSAPRGRRRRTTVHDRRCLAYVRDARGRFVSPSGASAADARRVREAAVPPAYTEPCITRDPSDPILWTATDRTGKRQTRYRPEWTSVRSAEKYAKMLAFGSTIARLRRRSEAIVSSTRGRGRRGVAAAAAAVAAVAADVDADRAPALQFMLMDQCRMRAGEPRNAAKGATSVDRSNIDLARGVVSWVAKSGVRRRCDLGRVPGERTPAYARRQRELLRAHLDEVAGTTSSTTTFQRYLKRVGGGKTMAKDTRMWHANVAFVRAVRGLGGPPVDAVDAVRKRGIAVAVAADALGHRVPATCDKSYLDPVVTGAARTRGAARGTRGRTNTTTKASTAARLQTVSAGDDGNRAMSPSIMDAITRIGTATPFTTRELRSKLGISAADAAYLGDDERVLLRILHDG